MSLHDNETRLLDYLDGTLPPGEKADLEAHCRSCAECRAALESAREAHQTLRGFTLRPGPDLTTPIMERVGRLPVPTADSSMARPWLPFVLVIGLAFGGLLALLVGLVPSGQAVRTPEPATSGEATPPTPTVATSSLPPVPPAAPPVVILAGAKGTWKPESVRVADLIPDGTKLQTGPDGRLELACAHLCTGRSEPGPPMATFATLVLLPDSIVTVEAGAFQLTQGSAWLQAAPPPRGASPRGAPPVTISHGNLTCHAHTAQAGLTSTPDGLHVCLFTGSLEVATQPAAPPLTVPALTAVRLGEAQVRVESLATASARAWLPFLDPGLRFKVFPPPPIPPRAGASDAVLASPTVVVSGEASADEMAPLPERSEPASGPNPGLTSAGTDLDETLLHHQPSGD